MRPSWQGRFDEFWQPEPTSGCWLWLGGSAGQGYGQFWKERRRERAHRVAYERWVGPIPQGLVLDHLCRNRLCVNPDHLEAVTSQENILRGEHPSARNAVKTRCVYGHEFTSENTARNARGHRARKRAERRARS